MTNLTKQTVSVLVRALNESEHLENLVRSLKNQTVKPNQLVLVDSGSVDGTPELAEKLGFEVFHMKQVDFSFGRSLNLGVSKCSGDVIVNMSAHVVATDNQYLEKMTDPLSKGNDLFVFGRQMGTSDTAFSERVIMSRWFPRVTLQTPTTPFANNASSAFLKKTWEDIKFDEKLPGLEDIDFCKKLISRGGSVYYASEACIFHIHNESWKAIKNRYRREAFALKIIFTGSRMGLLRCARYFVWNVMSDIGILLKNREKFTTDFFDIFRFRTAQFIGAYVGGRQIETVDPSLRSRIYEPRKFGP